MGLNPKDKEALEGKLNLKVWGMGGKAGVGDNLTFYFNSEINIYGIAC